MCISRNNFLFTVLLHCIVHAELVVLFDWAKVDFTGLYQAFYIHENLGVRQAFQSYYIHNRRVTPFLVLPSEVYS